MKIELVGTYLMDGESPDSSRVNFSFQSGDLVLVAGRESSGKSLLFDLLRLKMRPSSGHILVDGVNPFDEKMDREGYLRMLGIVPEPGSYPHVSTLKSLLKTNFHLVPELGQKEYENRVDEGMAILGLSLEREWTLGYLSRSERVRFLLLLEIVRNPTLLLLDSTLSEAGEMWGEKIFLFCRKICQDDRIVIMMERIIPEYLEERETKMVEDSGPFRFITFYRKYEAAI